MFNPKVLLQLQTPNQRRERFQGLPNLWLMSLVAVAAVGAGAMFAGRDRLHFQAGCAQDCDSLPDRQRTLVSAGLKSNPDKGHLYALQLVRRDLPGEAVSADSKPGLDTITAAVEAKPAVDAGSRADSDATAVPSSDPFRDAVNAAIQAANLTQTAQSPQEWVTVGRHWQKAIANMKAVPVQHARYNLAQQKAQEYSNNLNYAKQNAGAIWLETDSTLSPAASSVTSTTETLGAAPSANHQAVQPQPSSVTSSQASADPENSESQPTHSKLLLMLLVGGGLALVLSLEPLRFFRKDEPNAQPPKPKTFKEPVPWGLMISNWIHDLWEIQPFFNTERVYKMTAASSAHKLQRKLYRKLMSLTGDQAMALQLIKENLKRHPGQSVNWCCEQAIQELSKQRQREHVLKKASEIRDKPLSEESGWV